MKIVNSDSLDLAVEAIASGELVIVPTRRWYMICADARDVAACNRIYDGKRRPPTKALAFVVPSYPAASRLFAFNPAASKLAEEFWPGDLAMILPWSDSQVGSQHAAVGSPNALVVNETGVLGELARRSIVPIAATSANISGSPGVVGPGPSISLPEVMEFVNISGLDVAVCIAGGICPAGEHLTMVDCTGSGATIARSGLVHDRAIAAALAQM
ncbi:L-threonylcarbamoyladenylate synthase [Nocardia sp. NPDC004068]|uniref:L-threonylcarbamoyladenylate synthase n=1 Tax=Nocardia sp. NPDC004068 TaxID=3364303 RepID=UPI0036ACEF88